MALVRILIDGYSLLHSWPQLAPGKPRHSEAARDALMDVLTAYHDVSRVPLTIFFDGAGSSVGKGHTRSGRAVEVLYSKGGQTADELIERAAHRFAPYGEVMAVSNDHAERDTVRCVGGLVCSCENFVVEVENTLSSLSEDLKAINQRERRSFAKRQNRP